MTAPLDRPLSMTRIAVEGLDSLSATTGVFTDTASRCGVYVLHFVDGYEYVGQAHDVFTRFRTHVRSWKDPIIAIDFAAVHADQLNAVERAVIQHREREGAKLRNSALVGMPMGDSPLDVVIERSVQEEWLNGVNPKADLSKRKTLARSRTDKGKGYEQLSSRPDYHQLLTILATYVQHIIPTPARTEQRFWNVTAMPSTNRSRTHQRLCSLNVNNMEVLVLMENLDDDGAFTTGFINLAPGLRLPGSLPIEIVDYGPCGDVAQFSTDNVALIEFLLYHPLVRDAARTACLGLMRKGTSLFSRFHSFPLADDIFEAIE